MPRSSRSAAVVWDRWKAFARRAAQLQSAAVLWVLYYAMLVPLAFLSRASRSRSPWRAGARGPAWLARTSRTDDLTSARRQF